MLGGEMSRKKFGRQKRRHYKIKNQILTYIKAVDLAFVFQYSNDAQGLREKANALDNEKELRRALTKAIDPEHNLCSTVGGIQREKYPFWKNEILKAEPISLSELIHGLNKQAWNGTGIPDVLRQPEPTELEKAADEYGMGHYCEIVNPEEAFIKGAKWLAEKLTEYHLIGATYEFPHFSDEQDEAKLVNKGATRLMHIIRKHIIELTKTRE
jgi:hypothetical protein